MILEDDKTLRPIYVCAHVNKKERPIREENNLAIVTLHWILLDYSGIVPFLVDFPF